MKNAKIKMVLLLIVIPFFTFSQNNKNILFIAIDDMKPLIGEYGYNNVKTPNIDELSSSGTIFKNAYCQFPVCGPSRASVMTGMRPNQTGILDLKTRMRDVNPDILTIPQYFKQNGYSTVAKGKIFDPRCVKSRKEDDPESWSIPYSSTHGEADKYNKFGRIAAKIIDEPETDFTDVRIKNESLELLSKLSADSSPFFLAVGFKKPHLPFFAPKKYFDLYDREQFEIESNIKVPENSNPDYLLNDNGELSSYYPTPIDGDSIEHYPKRENESTLHEDQQRELLHGYHACVTYIDAQIGMLIEGLKKSGKYENTIIVIWGDHGFHLGDHGLWGKHSTMEESARVPLIIIDPSKLSQKKVSNEIVELIDVFPTLCNMTDLEIPKALLGKNIFGNNEENGVGYAFTQYKRKGATGYSVRSDRFRYTEWISNKTNKVVYKDLFDMKNDSKETKNVVELYREEANSLSGIIHSKLKLNK